mgnify:FL=1
MLLTAYGLALLLSLMLNRKMAAFLVLGFLLASYLGLSVTAVSLIAVCLAVILLGVRHREGGSARLVSAGPDNADYDPLEDDDE